MNTIISKGLRQTGAAVLYGRIRAAAEKVCSPYDSSRLAAKAHLDACINEAISKAVARVDAPALSCIYSAKMKTFLPSHLVSLESR